MCWANRLVKAATASLGRLRIRKQSRIALAGIGARLDNVSLEEFPPNAVPEVAFDRLNEHYREVVTLATAHPALRRHRESDAAPFGQQVS